MVQMGSGTLSTRTRASLAGFCVVQIEGGRLTQDVVAINREGLEIRRNYDSQALHPEGDATGTRTPPAR